MRSTVIDAETSVSANALGLPKGSSMTAQPHASRRLFLAAGSARAVFGALTQAVAQTADLTFQAANLPLDPIFAALERHRAAHRAFLPMCDLTDDVRAEREGREVTDADWAAYDVASAAETEALETLIDTPPTSKEGARAAIEWLADYDRGCQPSHVGQFAMTLLRSPVLADLEARS
jgi:hypothetical protein